MNKDDKPVERELARGSVTPQELIRLLQLAAADATYTSIRVNGSDGHSAHLNNINELAPIEDATHVGTVHATFTYEDRSELTIKLFGYTANTVTAQGQMARTRQSQACEYWADIPDRSRLNYKHIGWIQNMSTLLLVSSVVACLIALKNREIRTSGTGVAMVVSYALIAGCIYLFARTLPGVRAIGHLVVLRRPSRVDTSKIVSTLVGIGGLALAVVAYLYPRK